MNQVGTKLLRPDMADVAKRWEAFWAGESDRPMIWGGITDPVLGAQAESDSESLYPDYPVYPNADFRKIAQNLLKMFQRSQDYVGDGVPYYSPSFGPDQFAAFLGVKIEYSPDSRSTCWSMPLEKELEDIPPLALDDSEPMLVAMGKFISTLAEVADGRFVVGHLDFHSNLDTLIAMRGPENFCFDMIEKPELAKMAIDQTVGIYRELMTRFQKLGNMNATGTTSWMPAYSTKLFQALASDYICLLSPEMARKFVIPAIDEEASFCDCSIYHLDGPDAVAHLDDLLSIPKINAIQWVPGDGNQPNGPYWLELYKRILAKGKGIWMDASPETAKAVHAELKSNKIIYCTTGTRAQVTDLVAAVSH